MSGQEKLVTVALPIYNGSDTVRRTIDSLLSQTYKNFEFLISDNESTDETRNICESYAARDSRIKYVRQKENLGPVKNYYYLLTRAKGEYFMWIADDDWWSPNYIESLVSALDKNPGHGVAQSGFQRVLKNGKVFDEERFAGQNDVTNKNHFTVYGKIFTDDSLLNHFCYGLYRRELISRALNDNPLMVYYSWDKILVSEFALSTKFYCVPEVLRFVDQRRTASHSRKLQKWFPPYAYSKMLARSYGRILGSRIVPFRMKLSAIIPLCSVIWHQRRRFIGFCYKWRT